MKWYLDSLKKEVNRAYEIARKARARGVDPLSFPEIKIASDVASRVEGLIGIEGIAERIRELQDKVRDDEEVALLISEEVALGKFREFTSEREAIEYALRVGLAYLTQGVVAAPLEGLASAEIRDNYLALNFAGPIRSAGGTAQAFTVVIADYVRRKLGIGEYEPTNEEIGRYIEEISLYDRFVRLQYSPTPEEIGLIVRNVKVCIDGEPTENIEVSKFRNLKKVETNRLRGGVCLVIAEGLALKAPKLLKIISKIGEKYGLNDWLWIKELVEIQQGIGRREENSKNRLPKYLHEVPAGRPVFSLANKPGAFRLRYGRSRTSGFAAVSVHPATMILVDDFLAIGTQIRPNIPGKAAVVTPCNTIEGPIVKLKNGDVIQVNTASEAKKIKKDVEKILFLGDILISFGDFYHNNVRLAPAAWCEEWWKQEALKKIRSNNLQSLSYLQIIEKEDISFEEAFHLSKKFDIPLHPKYTFFWHDISKEELVKLINSLRNARIEKNNLLLPIEAKDVLEKLCVLHRVKGNNVIVENGFAKSLLISLGIEELGTEEIEKAIKRVEESEEDDVIRIVNSISKVKIMPKGLTRIGARMGRPEKAKERKMNPPPNILFPTGEKEGRRRDLVKIAKEKEKIYPNVARYECVACKTTSIYPVCGRCGKRTILRKICPSCGRIIVAKECKRCNIKARFYEKREVNIKELLEKACRNLNIAMPNAVRGVLEMSSEYRSPEPLEKGILRAIYNLYVYKDGTIRFDATNVPITHFKPKEVDVSVKKLRELGYTKDYKGDELKDENQIVELLPQDIIISEEAARHLIKVAKFIDDLLVKYYKLEPYYNVKSKEDLIGKLVIGLAPHTSAGIIGRIIGFTKANTCFAHPYWHAAKRRNCLVGDEQILLYEKENKKFIVRKIKDLEKEDLSKYLAVSLNEKGEVVFREIEDFVKLKVPEKIYEIVTETGRRIKVTADHKMIVYENGKIKIKKVEDLKNEEYLLALAKFDVNDEIKEINLIDYFANYEDASKIRVKGVKELVDKKIKEIGGYSEFCKKFNTPFTYRQLWNYVNKDAIPLPVFLLIKKKLSLEVDYKKVKISYRKNNASLPAILPLDKKLGFLAGLYVSDGHSRTTYRKDKEKYVYQVVWCIGKEDREILDFVKECCKEIFNREPSVSKREDENVYILTLSGKIYFELFRNVLGLKTDAYKKRADNIINFSREFKEGFIAGVVHGDGSVDKSIIITTVNKELANDISLILLSLGVYPHLERNDRQTNFSKEKITFYNIRVYSEDLEKLKEILIGRKGRELKKLPNSTFIRKKRQKIFGDFKLIKIKEINEIKNHTEKYVYDLVLKGEKTFIAGFGWLATYDCDGDEDSIILLMDALLNFSTRFLPEKRGGKMDTPLVLTVTLNPEEVDDEVFDMDIAESYPLAFYRATFEEKDPSDVKEMIKTVSDILDKEKYYGFKFTHDTSDFNDAPIANRYKEGAMIDKLKAQLNIAEKIRAVDENLVAELVVTTHLLRDIKGNLRTFANQKFRCIKCNAKYRRIPLLGRCLKCGGNIVLTVSKGTVEKYLEASKMLAANYNIAKHIKQQIELIEMRISTTFGERQATLETFAK